MRFFDSVGSGDWEGASAASSDYDGAITMPGVTTMWIGNIARGIWNIGRGFDLWSNDQAAFVDSQEGLAIAQTSAAVVCSILIGLVTFLVARWAGLGAAFVTGVLLATEPFFVALGAVLHTDELVTLFGIGALVATALALGLPQHTSWYGRWWAGAVAGALAGAALLTKVSALGILAGVPLMGLWALVQAWRADARRHDDDSEPTRSPMRPLMTVGAWWTLTAVVVIVLAYPALWVAPLQEYDRLVRSAQMASRGHTHYFLGEVTRTPGPLYLFVTLPLRSTPWFLATGLAAGVFLWVRSATRQFAWLLVCMGLPTFLAVSFASKQSVRYGLPVLAVAAIAVGIMATSLPDTFPRSEMFWRRCRWIAAGGAVFVTLHTIAIAPWGIAYFNPALGGSSTAVRAHTVGSGEGLERAGAMVQEREAGRCDEILVWTYPIQESFPCGRVTSTSKRDSYLKADYVVLYVNQRQRSDPDLLEDVIRDRELLDEVSIRGIDHAELYGPVDGSPERFP